jgi:predicted RNA-binding Zn-ribbon protein involved in translation (DUF1610 family)
LTTSVNTGTMAGTGTFRCQACGFPVALQERDAVPACPHCGEQRFVRSSLFHAFGEPAAEPIGTHDVAGQPAWLAETRETLAPGTDYLVFDTGAGVRAVALPEGFMRIGRSLAAEVRFDDPTVSRRHAIVHREDGQARLLDDRSLNGVFVNGERAEWHELGDGDEILIGRFRMYFLKLTGAAGRGESERAGGALA